MSTLELVRLAGLDGRGPSFPCLGIAEDFVARVPSLLSLWIFWRSAFLEGRVFALLYCLL